MKKILCAFLCLFMLSTTALASIREGYSSDDPEQWDDWEYWEYIDYGYLEGCAYNPYSGEWLDFDWEYCYSSADDFFETIEYHWSDEWGMWAGPDGFIDEDYIFHEYDLDKGYIDDGEYHLFPSPEELPEVCPECDGIDGEHDEDCPIYLEDHPELQEPDEPEKRDRGTILLCCVAFLLGTAYLCSLKK